MYLHKTFFFTASPFKLPRFRLLLLLHPKHYENWTIYYVMEPNVLKMPIVLAYISDFCSSPQKMSTIYRNCFAKAKKEAFIIYIIKT